MTTRNSSVVADLLRRGVRVLRATRAQGPRPLTRAAGRARSAGWPPAFDGAQQLEARVLLDGDHPSFPVPFNPSVGTVLTLDAVSPLTSARRGRALTGANEGVSGTIAAGDTGDTFRFTMPTVAGRTSDFVTVLADTLLAPDGSSLNSTLDTYVEVYNSTGARIAFGNNNGVLSSAAAAVPDGWLGFVGTPGESYTILVKAQATPALGRTSTGNYTLRVDTTSIEYGYDGVVNPTPMPGQETFGEGDVPGALAIRQDEVVYRVTTGTEDEYDSMASAGAIADDAAVLDTHLEIYDSGNTLGQVSEVARDLQAGRLTNAFATWASAKNTTYYIRVRSDEINSGRPATGAYSLAVDLAAFRINIDPVTRLAQPMMGPPPLDFQDAVAPLAASNAPAGTASRLYTFTAQGTGVSFITIVGLGQVPLNGIRQPGGLGNYPALLDPAVHMYNSAGTEVAFNDDFNGFTPQLEVNLIGGQDYYLVVEGFDRALHGDFGVFIEAHYTNVSTDDHVNDMPQGLINFDLATPLLFGNPFLLTDADGNPILDRSWLQSANHRGRLYNAGDTDLFQFVAPVSTLDSYEGDDGNEGRALYVGGNFGTADRLNPNNLATLGFGAPNVAIWDADDWWNAGPNQELMGLDTAAFFGAPSAINGPIFAMTEWDPDGAGPLETSLVAGGRFTDTDGNFTNLALRIYSPIVDRFVWLPMTAIDPTAFSGAATDSIRALHVWNGDLYVGGRFNTYGAANNNLFRILGDGSFGIENFGGGGVTGGANPTVFSFAAFDPPMPHDPPDPDGAGPQPDPDAPDDPPEGLYIGGQFTTAGGLAAANIVRYGLTGDPMAMDPDDRVYTALEGGGTNGPVFAMATYTGTGTEENGVDGTFPGGPFTDHDEMIETRLYVGGDFTTAGGQATAFFASYTGRAPVTTTNPDYRPNTAWRDIGALIAVPGPVRTITKWRPPVDDNGNPTPGMTGMTEELIVGGDGLSGGADSGLVFFMREDNGAPLLTGANVFDDGTVRTLHVFEDDEMNVAGHEIVYAGGDFTMVDGTADFDGDGVNDFNRIAKLDDPNHDAMNTWKPLKTGVAGLAPGEVGATSVFAVHSFADALENQWDRNERPAGRVTITVAPTTDAFLNAFVTVYDSNFNVIYTNDTKAPPFPDPAGTLDPASAAGPGTPDGLILDGLWAGETYYISVRDVNNSGTGRYTINVTMDALPPEDPDDGDGVYVDVISVLAEVPNEGQWADAPELTLNGNGDTSNFEFITPTPTATQRRVWFRTPGDRTQGGVRRAEQDRFAVIEKIGDTDLYQFRASATGTVEIRIATTNLQDQYDEDIRTQTPNNDFVFNSSGGGFDTLMVDTPIQQLRAYNSPLDAMVTVFNNDFEVQGVNDDGRAVTGFVNGYNFAQIGRASFFRQRDSRLVIPVVGGETYFVQIESAYRETFNTDPSKVDWRHATGAYELVINNTQSSNGIDDYEDNDGGTLNNFADQTAIPIDFNTGDGTITGTIDNVPTGAFTNIIDTDAFRFVTDSRGNATVTVDATSPNLRPAVRIFDSQGGLRAQGSATVAGGQVSLTLSAVQGSIFFVVVDGQAGSEGSYEVRVDSVGLNDDFKKDGDWLNATPLGLNAFLGTYTTSGIIENAADEDLFTFTAEEFEVATVTVTAQDATLDPFVLVYEINADGQDPMNRNPSFMLIAANDDANGLNSQASFSVSAGRQYFIVVTGSDRNTHFGRYDLAVNVIPTDDHPNRTDFPLATQIDLSTNFDPLTLSSTATADGSIEVNTDDDMFRFIAPATGSATVTITTPSSLLSAALFVYDSANTLVGTANATNGTSTFSFNISQNIQYYVQVIPGPLGPNQTDDFGDYTVTIVTEPIDDFPNDGDFANPNVGVITLNSSTGVGQRSGVIVPSTDSDLFRFTTLAAGSVTIRMTTAGSSLNPRIRVYDSSFAELPGPTSNGDTATLTFNATGAGQTFYITALPNTGATGTSAVGNYTVQVTAAIPGGGGGTPDDHADAGEFNDATAIPLDSRTGFGSAIGSIETSGDTDLFKFVAPANGRAGVQIKTPSGGLVDGRIKVYNQSFALIGEDASGIPGATAAFNFNAVAGQTYYVLLEPIGVATGSYVVEAFAQPLTHFLYFPEGFAGSTIDEFVPIVNPNSFAVDFAVYARYETGANPNTPIATGTVPANSRGGVTISTKTGASLVDRGRPYALEIQSTGQLGATLSHYDFNVSVGEAFTGLTSTTWTFAQVNKDRNTFRDFALFYNPFNTPTNVTIELFYSDGTKSVLTQPLDGLRRGGINFDNDSRITKVGRFGMRITADSPIVASLSTYNISNSGGDGLLGDAEGGNTVGVIPNISSGGGVTSSISFLNTNLVPATITVTASYSRVDLPDLVRVITVQPGRQFTQSLSSLGLINGQQAGIRFASNVAVTGSVIEYQNGDGDSTAAATHAAQQYIFGDLFVNPASAGITYIEKLGLYNPSSTAIDIALTFLFTDGTSSTVTVNAAAGDFAFVQIDQQQAILSRGQPTAFSLVASASTPIVASLSHYDLFLNGGWSTLGATVGLTVPLNTIA
ncbi:MAG: hypothetical protein IT438_13750 [Phycisphaerales bacterium]|nr:hypothetical protein [Phycisphaerales bacterium]